MESNISNIDSPISPISSIAADEYDIDTNDNNRGISSRIKVCVRLRPLIKTDYDDINNYNKDKTRMKKIRSTPSIATTLNPDGQTIRVVSDIQETKQYTYDHSFDRSVSPKELYDQSCRDAVTSFMNGYNACIMCYGQSGSG